MSAGEDYSRLSCELPTSHAKAAKQVLGLMDGVRDLSLQSMDEVAVERVWPVTNLYSVAEDPYAERLVPIVQRPHIRKFNEGSGWEKTGAAERLISGLWINGPSASNQSKESQWRKLNTTVVFERRGVGILGIRASQTDRLYRMLASEEVDLRNIGPMTIQFLGELSAAVQAELRPAG